MGYFKGQKLQISMTYIIDVVLEQDCEREADLGELATAALLSSKDLHSHCEEVCVVAVDEVDVSDEAGVNAFEREDANKLWDQLREGKNRGLFPDLDTEQTQFIVDVVRANREDDLEAYSGRGMFGVHCPAIRVEHASEVPTTVRYDSDSMGKTGRILYVRR